MRVRCLSLLALGLLACSSSSSGDAPTPSNVDRTKKISAAVSADLPLVCDAWAAGVGGYGKPDNTQDCGSVKNTARAPASQSDCVSMLAGESVSSCTATIGAFLDCQIALYAKPCATVGEAPSCAALFPGPCWH